MASKETDAERATRIHNEGQKDGSDNKYEPPHSGLWNTTVGSDRDIEDNKSYDEGYRHARDQSK